MKILVIVYLTLSLHLCIATRNVSDKNRNHVKYPTQSGENHNTKKEQGSVNSELNNTKNVPEAAHKVPLTEYKFDFRNPDESKITCSEEDYGSARYKNCKTQADFGITSLVDGEVEIWTIGDDEECTNVEFYRQGNDMLCVVTVKGKIRTTLKYFEKDEKGWKNSTREEFAQKLRKMKGQSTGRST